MDAEPVFIFIGIMVALVAIVCIAHWLLHRDRIVTNDEIDSLPSTLLHGPERLPDWVRVEGGEKTLWPFSATPSDEVMP